MDQYQIVISPRASRDIRTIERHTHKLWEAHQASAYVENIWEAIASLATFPEIGRVVAMGPPNTRRISVDRHIIFYRIGESSIEISRVVHERRDVAWLLD